MVGVTWNNKKYILSANGSHLKYKSFEDNLYFTIREIFSNIESEFMMYEANAINAQLSNGIAWEDRDDKFEYYKLATDSDFIAFTLKFLNSIRPGDFDFEFETDKANLNAEVISNEYVCFDTWWKNLEWLRKKLQSEY